MPNLHLIEPYRSLLLRAAYDENLFSLDERLFQNSIAMRIGNNKSAQIQMVQFFLLFDEVSITYQDFNNSSNESDCHFFLRNDLARLEDIAGIKVYSPTVDDEADIGQCRDPYSLWCIYKEPLFDFKELIKSQLKARGKEIDPALFDLWIADRTGDRNKAKMLHGSLKNNLKKKHIATSIVNSTKESMSLFDYPIFAELSHLQAIEKLLINKNIKILGHDIEDKKGVKPWDRHLADMALKIRIDSLLDDYGIILPVPKSIRDLARLRKKPEVKRYKECFFPWLESLSNGDIEIARELKLELLKLSRYFQNDGEAKKLYKVLGVGGIALAVLEQFLPGSSLPGAGFAVTVTELVVPRIFNRYGEASKWLLSM